MRSSWSEPYLWVHLAGIAAVPIFLELCLIGLSASQVVLPAGLVFLLVAIVGISPVLWMQWYRPFSIFSLVVLALKPNQLTERQRQILQQFKTPLARAVSVGVAIGAFLILWQLNQWLPFPMPMLRVPGGWFGGLLLAATAFLLSNLFLQVPASALMVLLTPERQLAAVSSYPVAQIPSDFTLIGLQVKQILPPLVSTPAPTPSPAASKPAASSTVGVAAVDATQAAVQPEAAVDTQSKVAQSKLAQPEVTQPQSESMQAVTADRASVEAVQAAIQAEPIQAVLREPKLNQPPDQKPPSLETLNPNRSDPDLSDPVDDTTADTAEGFTANRKTPSVTDTIVTIQLPLMATPASLEPTEGAVEAPNLDAALPTVTDTIVTIYPPLPVAAVPPEGN